MNISIKKNTYIFKSVRISKWPIDSKIRHALAINYQKKNTIDIQYPLNNGGLPMKNLPGRIRGGFSRGRVAQWQVQGPPFAPPNRSFVRRHKSGGVMRHVLTEGHPMDSHRGVGRTQGGRPSSIHYQSRIFVKVSLISWLMFYLVNGLNASFLSDIRDGQ